ncbi:hypothetical protein ACHAW5_003014 [Stephanodiscus triporus]|uniref:SCP domain-containing protein n=1 Tax=Stephanodiscus triporus TaxID=2934178 RepID=A0ABD3NWM3_9STRA
MKTDGYRSNDHDVDDGGMRRAVAPDVVREPRRRAADVVGNLVEDGRDGSSTTMTLMGEKGYSPDTDSVALEGTHLLGGGDIQSLYSFHDRRRAEGSSCLNDSESEISIVLRTDEYGYETSWVMYDSSMDVVARGPPAGTNYDDSRTYSGSWCVSSPGSYRIVVSDSYGDGICAGGVSDLYGCGFFKVYLDGRAAGLIVNDATTWRKKTFEVDAVAPWESDRSKLAGGWCDEVAGAMAVPSGTCILPNGRRGHRVRVTTKVDQYGEETSWAIERDGVVMMRMGAIVPSNSVRAVEDCLPAGNYDFTIWDFDGICCKHGDGRYELVVDGEELLNGGTFMTAETHSFKLGHDWISGMSDRDCEWWWSHHIRRQDWHTRCYAEYCNKDYRHLRWSSTLAADALDYAVRLLDTCDETGMRHDHTDAGENLAKNKGSEEFGEMYPADLIVGRFVDNEEFWGWNDNAHLTQAIWYASRYLGCADSERDMGDGKTCRMQVCRYAKAGNCMMGAYSSDVGNNWRTPMMADDSPCGPMCPRDGCHL